MRARSYLKSKSDVVLSVAHVKRMMRAHVARNPITFGLLRTTDDATYVNRSLSRPLLVFGVGGSDASLSEAASAAKLAPTEQPR